MASSLEDTKSQRGVEGCGGVFFFFLIQFNVPFKIFFTHRDEPIDRWGETGVPRENHLTHPQAELGLSHMWPVWGSSNGVLNENWHIIIYPTFILCHILFVIDA